jgi:hypothetical protein
MKVSASEKQIIYEAYKNELGEKVDYVDKQRFYELWNVLFPKVIQRVAVDICGKCWLCYEVEKLRQTSEESIVQEYAKRAHHLHRGGMFMLERNEYVKQIKVLHLFFLW